MLAHCEESLITTRLKSGAITLFGFFASGYSCHLFGETTEVNANTIDTDIRGPFFCRAMPIYSRRSTCIGLTNLAMKNIERPCSFSQITFAVIESISIYMVYIERRIMHLQKKTMHKFSEQRWSIWRTRIERMCFVVPKSRPVNFVKIFEVFGVRDCALVAGQRDQFNRWVFRLDDFVPMDFVFGTSSCEFTHAPIIHQLAGGI